MTEDKKVVTPVELTAEELAFVAGGCTCEKFDDGSGGLTVKPH